MAGMLGSVDQVVLVVVMLVLVCHTTDTSVGFLTRARRASALGRGGVAAWSAGTVIAARPSMRPRLAPVAQLAFAFALIGSACSPTYAPMMRAVHYGAPGRLEQGRIEIAGTAGGAPVPVAGGPSLAYGLRDWAAIEGGANLYVPGTDKTEGGWATGFVGTRLTLPPARDRPVHFAGDLELGVGGGVGGVSCKRNDERSCSVPDEIAWYERPALGAYQGFGIGLHIHWFTVFMRARIEESAARNAPITLWPSMVLGVEAAVKRTVYIGLAGGYMAYWNEVDTSSGVVAQLNVAVLFDVTSAARGRR